MKYKWTLAFLIILYFETGLLAQQLFIDIIHLKTGGKVSGEIMRYEQGKSLVIKLPDGAEQTINDSDILKIKQGTLIEKEAAIPAESGLAEGQRAGRNGGFGAIQIPFGLGSDQQNGFAVATGIHGFFGYRWSQAIAAGAGFGVDSYSRRGEIVFPLYGEIRAKFANAPKGGSYYFAGAAGYGFAFKRQKSGILEADGGWMAHPAAGYSTVMKNGVEVSFDAGLKLQKAFFIRQIFNGDIEERDILFRRYTFRMGMTLWK